MSTRIRMLMVACAMILIATVPAAGVTSNDWARPLTNAGLPNLHKVSDTLYRGAQPTAEGFVSLRKMGIKTVVSLRNFHSDKKLLGTNGLGYVAIPMNTWDAERADVVAFLRVVTDTNRTPVFVHCQHGADRTGTMCALYRIAVCGWSKEDALKEMTEGGFGFHEIWQNLLEFIDKLDVETIKTETGIKRPQAPAAAKPASPQAVEHSTNRLDKE